MQLKNMQEIEYEKAFKVPDHESVTNKMSTAEMWKLKENMTTLRNY